MSLSKRVRVAALSGAATVALLAALPRAAEAQERPGWYGSLEGRYLMSDGDRTSQLNALPLFAPIATSVPPGGDGGGGKVSLGYRFASPWDVRFALSANQLGEVSQQTPVVFIYNPFVGFQQHSTASTDYQLLDFDAGYNFVLGGVDLRLSGGLRYAHFNENYSDTFAYVVPFFGSLPFVDYRRVKFSGLGPLLGARARLPLGRSPFAVIGAAGGSALFGTRTSQETNATFGMVNLRDEKGVYEAEGELSLAYSFAGAWTAELGYRVEQWWNIVETRSVFFAPVLATGNHSDGNLLTHGPFLRVDLHF